MGISAESKDALASLCIEKDNDLRVTLVMRAIKCELLKAQSTFAPMNSHHEGYAVIREEVDEMWDDIKKNKHAEAVSEAIQVGAMAARFLVDLV